MRNGAMFSIKQWAATPPVYHNVFRRAASVASPHAGHRPVAHTHIGGSKANATPRAKQAAAATPLVYATAFRCAASVASPHPDTSRGSPLTPPKNAASRFAKYCEQISSFAMSRQRNIPTYVTAGCEAARLEICRKTKQKKNGASCRSRTGDLVITSQLLYQLS